MKISSKFFNNFKKLFYFFYGESFFKKINFDWSLHPSRYEIINKIIEKKKFKTYLEIGCDTDENFNKIKIQNRIGVDPNSGGTHKMTSDTFFSQNNKKFDLIFIDGLHVHDQVNRDIENSLKFLNSKGIILLHDCLPSKIWNQIVPPMYPKWNGDVWKSIVKFRTRKDINVYTILADQGLGVILNEKNKNTLNLEIENFQSLTFKDYYYNYKKYMNLVNVDQFFKILDSYN